MHFCRYLATLTLDQRLGMSEDAMNHDLERTLLFENHSSQIQ